jgi:predicted PurR-regulated permease PerM
MLTLALGFHVFSLLKDFFVFLLNVLSPFLASLLIAYIMSPIVIQLQKHLKLGRIMGTLLLYLIIFLVIFVMLAFLIPTLLIEFGRLFATIKQGIPNILDWLSRHTHLKIDAELIENIKNQVEQYEIDISNISESILMAAKKIASGGLSAIGGATRGIFSGVSSMIGFFSFLVFVAIIGFYFIVDWEKILPLIKKMVPPKHRERTFDVLDKIDISMGGFLRGQITVCFIVGVMFAVGLFGMGFIGFPALRNYSILIGTLAGVAGFIPYLGAVIGVLPAILIILLTGDVEWSTKLLTFGGVILLFSLIQAVEGFILQPKVVGKNAGLHPLLVMLALIVGAQFGIGGMIIAVPLASVIRVLIREFYWLPIEQRETAMASFPTQHD